MSNNSNIHKANITVREFGERKLIQALKKHLELLPFSPVPFGDDVAAVPLSGEQVAILKTDMLVDKTDVPKGMSLCQAARKAIVMNVSDFAAKGVQPSAAVVSLGLPRTLLASAIEEIGEGLNQGAREYGAYVVGGDTGEASDLVISVGLFGTALRSRLMLRSGAKPGDMVGVTGLFGNPAAGLKLLSGNCRVSKELQDGLLESVFLPKAKLKEGLALTASGVVTSSIDSSDGLAWSLHELSRMSGVGFSIDRVPVAEGAKRFADTCEVNILELVFHGGEEYELVVTVKPESWAEAEMALEKVGGKLFHIGRVTTEKQVSVEKDGKKRPIEARGWEHFKSQV